MLWNKHHGPKYCRVDKASHVTLPQAGSRPVTVTSSRCVVILSTRYWHGSTCGAVCLEISTARTWTRIAMILCWHLRVLKDVWRIDTVRNCRLVVCCECTRDDGWLFTCLMLCFNYTSFYHQPLWTDPYSHIHNELKRRLGKRDNYKNILCFVVWLS